MACALHLGGLAWGRGGGGLRTAGGHRGAAACRSHCSQSPQVERVCTTITQSAACVTKHEDKPGPELIREHTKLLSALESSWLSLTSRPPFLIYDKPRPLCRTKCDDVMQKGNVELMGGIMAHHYFWHLSEGSTWAPTHTTSTQGLLWPSHPQLAVMWIVPPTGEDLWLGSSLYWEAGAPDPQMPHPPGDTGQQRA